MKGRDFSKNFGMDSAGLILNEASVKLTGLKDPVGLTFQWQGHPRQVIGIAKDMVMASPYRSAEPTVFFIDYTWNNYITMRVRPDLSMHDAVARLEPVFKKYDPGTVFNYEIADEEYARKFTAEERIGNLAGFFSSFAILISCLGLFGLASFVAEQRTKEIGVHPGRPDEPGKKPENRIEPPPGPYCLLVRRSTN